LPAGLSIDAPTGILTGNPLGPVSASSSYQINVVDQCIPTNQTGNALTAIEIVSRMILTVSTIPVLTEGVAFTTFTPVVATGGTTTKSFTISPTLPDGLFFNPATGQIAAGTPTITYVRTEKVFTVRVVDQCTTPQNKIATFTLIVRAQAQKVFNTTLGVTSTFTWTVPPGVTSISALCVGGGGGQGGEYQVIGQSLKHGGGGGGGALAYSNNIAVTPGATITVIVGGAGKIGNINRDGGAGGASSVKTSTNTIVCQAGGGGGGYLWANSFPNGVGGSGGTVDVGTGGAGGAGGKSGDFADAGGGGGAGGYRGPGGAGGQGINSGRFDASLVSGKSAFVSGTSILSGGGGGGAGAINTGPAAGAGGGVGLLGLPTSNIGGRGGEAGFSANPSNNGYSKGGGGGSGGATGGSGAFALTNGEPAPIVISGGGLYGGGGGKGVNSGEPLTSYGGDGAVRIIWPGSTRSYPNTGTADQFY
jgi:hypothetical protein